MRGYEGHTRRYDLALPQKDVRWSTHRLENSDILSTFFVRVPPKVIGA